MPEFGPWTLDCGLWTVDSGLWTDPDRENVRTIPAAVAIGAADEDVAEKLHFDLFEARAPAAFTLALAGVEAEGAGVQTPLPGGLGLGKKLADVIEGADIDSGIGARRFAQYGLVNQDDAAEMLPPLDEGGGSRVEGGSGVIVFSVRLGGQPVRSFDPRLAALEFGGEGREQDFADERGFAGTAHARDTHESCERDFDRQVLEVVFCGMREN